MRNTWDLDIVWVREMGLEVYAQAILSSLAILSVAVDAENVISDGWVTRNELVRNYYSDGTIERF